MHTMHSRIKTFVFMDCETTGLEPWARITELCFVAVQTQHLLSTSANSLPRVLNKLNLCFNPRQVIHPQAADITGLHNDLLEHTLPFTDNSVQMIECFIRQLPPPACLVSHNGDRFDYNILRNHIRKHELEYGYDCIANLLTVDTLKIARCLHDDEVERQRMIEEKAAMCSSLDVELTDDDDDDFLQRARLAQIKNEMTPPKKKELNEVQANGKEKTSKRKLNFGNKRPSFKLGDWYERLTGQEAVNSHEAEADVIMMAKCAAVLGDDFVIRANNTAQPFFKD